MKRFLLTIVALLGLCTEFVWAEEEILEERYVVVKGDTLWQIAALFTESGFDWKAIYDVNRDVLNDPHKLIPGQVLKLPGPDYVANTAPAAKKEQMTPTSKTAAAVASKEEKSSANEEEETTVEIVPPAQAASAPVQEPVSDEAIHADSSANNQAASAETKRRIVRQKEFLNYDGRIISSRDKDKVMLSQGDVVSISLGLKDGLVPGDELAIVRKTKQALDPRTRKRYWLIERLGKARVREEIFDERADCTITYSHDAVSLGDGVVRLPHRDDQE